MRSGAEGPQIINIDSHSRILMDSDSNPKPGKEPAGNKFPVHSAFWRV